MKYTSPRLSAIPHVVHGFFGCQGGVSHETQNSLNVAFDRGDTPDNVRENRRRIGQALSLDQLASLDQKHGLVVHAVNTAVTLEGDGLLTQTPRLGLGVMTADCVPVLFCDEKMPLVAAVHSGWRGAVLGILEEAVERLREKGAQNIVAALGPCIWQESYEVGMDVYEKVGPRFCIHAARPGHWLFDLPGFVTWRLQEAGVTQIDPSPQNTYTSASQYFSYRRRCHQAEKAQVHEFGCQMSVIALGPG